MEITCKHCGRFLFKQGGTVILEGIICPNSQCKAKMNFKLLSNDITDDLKYKFKSAEVPPRSKEKK